MIGYRVLTIYFCSAEDSPLYRRRDKCGFIPCSAGVQTPAEQRKKPSADVTDFKGELFELEKI